MAKSVVFQADDDRDLSSQKDGVDMEGSAAMSVQPGSNASSAPDQETAMGKPEVVDAFLI